MDMQRLMTEGFFYEHNDRRKKLQSLLDCMKGPIGPRPHVIVEFLEALLEYIDKAPSI